MSKKKNRELQEIKFNGLQDGIIVNYLGEKITITGQVWKKAFYYILEDIIRQRLEKHAAKKYEDHILQKYEAQLSDCQETLN